MSKQMTRQLESASPEDTERLGEQIGRQLRGGETIELASDLGGGKTTLVRGLMRGAGSTDHVASPTFTISKQYQAGSMQVHHFDFYRLVEAGNMREELAELVGEPEAVVLVEWSGIVQDVLPAQRLTIRLTATSEDGRQIKLDYPEELAYLVKEVKA